MCPNFWLVLYVLFKKFCFLLQNTQKTLHFFVCLARPHTPLLKALTLQMQRIDRVLRKNLWTWVWTHKSIWGSRQSARWSGRSWCPVRPVECAASHRGRSRRPCRPLSGTPAAAPPGGWWSRTRAGRCCCTHLMAARTESRRTFQSIGASQCQLYSHSVFYYRWKVVHVNF